MRVAITGGTGFVGKKLVHRLFKEGHEITLLSRSPEKAKQTFSFPTKAIAWTAGKTTLAASALAGIDVVLNLAGEGIADKRWTTARKKAIYDSRILGTRSLVDAVSQTENGPRRFISASAIGFYGDRGNEELNEGSAPGTGFLTNVCRDWEKEVEKLPKSVSHTCIRIGIVLGKEGGALKKLLPIFEFGAGGPVGNGNQWMSWIHVDDLVSLFAFLVKAENAPEIVNGVAPSPATNKDFSKALGRALHRPAILPAPALALKLAMGELSVLVLGSQKVFPKETEKTGFSFAHPKLLEALSDIVKKKAT